MGTPLVGIFMGSDSDFEVMEHAAKVLKEFGVPYEMHISSAHRSPEMTKEYATKAEAQGMKVLIAGAGMAAHLAGVLASLTILPVIGVPLASPPLNGIDALLSTLQMPPGVPVATVSIGKAGAKNAALLAVEILDLGDERLRESLKKYRDKMSKKVAEKDRKLKK